MVDDLVARAKAEGELRPDVEGPDLGLVQFMLGALADSTRDVAPELWRRFLAIVLDGLRTRRDGPSPLAPGPLDEEQLDRAMAAWRPAAPVSAGMCANPLDIARLAPWLRVRRGG